MLLTLPLLFALAQDAPKTMVAAWDTAQSSSAAWASEKLAAKSGWSSIARDQTLAAFKGDAVITNGRILVVARKQAPALEVYAVTAEKTTLRASLGLPAATIDRVALVENGRAAAALEVVAKTSKGTEVSAKFRLKRGEVSVEVEPGAGAERLRLDCPSRFVVLPDFFADDVLIDARRIPIAATDVPSENFLVHLAGAGDSVAMIVSESREQEIRITLAGEGERRLITGSEIAFGGKKKIWLALLEGAGMWHAVDLKSEDAKKVVPLDWTMPFVASWRCNMTRPNDLADSWDMLLQNKAGQEYIKPAWFGGPAEKVNDATRRRFTEVLGFFPYPVWSDPSRRGFLQPLELETRTKFVSVLTYRGPAVLYPFNRVPETPPDAFTVVDIARSCLGVGPCEYILDLENQKQEYKGVATCNARDALIAIYEKGEQKRKRSEIEQCLKDAHGFVSHIRARITLYMDFGRRMREYLAAQAKAHPELKGSIEELEKIAQEMDARFAEREEKIKTPAHVATMNEDFRKQVLDREGPEAVKACKEYGDALTRIGGNQDKLVSECRWVARTLRQRAGMLMATDPRMTAIAEETRKRSQEVLKSPSQHERARQ